MLALQAMLLVFVAHLSIGYLIPRDLDVITDLYNTLNGRFWTKCQWNITYLATEYNINASIGIPYCGISVSPKPPNQTITYIIFQYNNNLNGSFSESIGNLTDLKHIEIHDNTLLTGVIPDSFCKISHLSWIQFESANFNGTVPYCIASKMHLKLLWLSNIPLLSVDDYFLQRLCGNTYCNKHLWDLHLDTIDFKGNIPNCIGNNFPNLQNLWFANLSSLNTTIPSSIHNLKRLQSLTFQSKGIYGTIPGAIFINKSYLTTVSIAESRQIHGTIPVSLCTVHSIQALQIYSTSINGTIPQCLIRSKNLKYLHLADNDLSGAMIKLQWTELEVVSIANNHLTGSLSDIFLLDKYPTLELVALNSNKFYDADIGIFFKKLFTTSTVLQAITIYDNDYIGGTFPTFDDEIYLNHFRILAGQSLDIGGALPNNLHFASNVSDSIACSIVLYNNRLSSTIPEHLCAIGNNPSVTSDSYIINGNLFYIPNERVPSWLTRLFVSARSLYITGYDEIESIMIVAVSVFALIIIIVLKYKTRKNTNFLSHKDSLFLQQIFIVLGLLSNVIFIVILLILCVIYIFSCKYYSFAPTVSYLSLFFFENDNIWIQLFLLVTIFGYNAACLLITYKLSCYQMEIVYNNKISKPSIISSRKRNKTIQEKHSIHRDYILMSNADDYAQSDQPEKFVFTLISFIIYLTLYLFGVLILVLYIVSESLPNNNVLGINEEQQLLLRRSICFVIAINNSVITPKFISSLVIITNISVKHRSKIIMILRTLTNIIIPLFFSVILLNNCGSQWSKLWNECQNHTNFNIKELLIVKLSTYQYNLSLQISTHSQICKSLSFSDINWNRCLRSFLSNWCNVLMIKMIIMCFMPISILFTKYIKTCLLRKSITLYIDKEFVMLTSKLEIVFIFGIFCPLLFPIVVVAISSWLFYYKLATIKLKWELKFQHAAESQYVFPFNFLYFAVWMQQALTFLFYYFCIQNTLFAWILLIVDVIMDVLIPTISSKLRF